MEKFWHILLHLDTYLNTIVTTLGPWTYVIIFVIIFCETGSIFGALFPGDSLLFTIGVTAAITNLDVHTSVLVVAFGAILGDSLNYFTGKKLGSKLFKKDARFFKKSHLAKTRYFFRKYGNKAIIMSRFIAFARTFTPFFAGMSRMNYFKFFSIGVISAFIWATTIIYLSYYFSSQPYIRKYFGILIISFIIFTIIYNFIKNKK